MKKIIFPVVLVIGALFLTVSCSPDLTTDGKDSKGIITVKAIGDNSDGSVSIGGHLDLELTLADGDGIALALIEIPALNINFLNKYESGMPNWKIKQTYNIEQINLDEASVIYITLEDTGGNNYTKTVPFSFK